MRLKFIVVSSMLLTSVLLASCSGISRVPSFVPHKMDIRQGNMVTPEMRSKIKVGQSRAQVSAILGTPLISDALHANRWDYVYRFEQDRKLIQQKNMTVFFDGDVLTRIDDGNMPPQPVTASAVEAVPPVMPDVTEPAPVEQVVSTPEAAPDTDATNVVPLDAVPPTIEQAAVDAVQEPAVDAVKAWAAAWSARDVEKYLSSYAPEFKPAKGLSRHAWEVQRRKIIAKANAIKVELSDIKGTMQDESHASVSFMQSYRADNYADRTHKMLELERIGDAWLIVAEQATESKK